MSLSEEDLPVFYEDIPYNERGKVRGLYAHIQGGACYHCKAPLDKVAPRKITGRNINRALFPIGFFNYPIHLHHSHDTGLTLGAVHCHCNAVLWQYHGE